MEEVAEVVSMLPTILVTCLQGLVMVGEAMDMVEEEEVVATMVTDPLILQVDMECQYVQVGMMVLKSPIGTIPIITLVTTTTVAATPVQALQEGTLIARMMAIIPLHQRSQPSHSPRYRNHRTAVEEEVAAVPVVVVVPPPVVVAVVVAEAEAPVAADTSLHRPPTARASTPATANPHFQPHQSQKPTTVKITRIQDPPTVVPIQVRILVLMRNMNGKVDTLVRRMVLVAVIHTVLPAHQVMEEAEILAALMLDTHPRVAIMHQYLEDMVPVSHPIRALVGAIAEGTT